MRLSHLLLGITIFSTPNVLSVRPEVDIDVARTKISVDSPTKMEATCVMGGCEQQTHNGSSYCRKHYH